MTLDLGDLVRIDRVAAIEREHHAVHCTLPSPLTGTSATEAGQLPCP
jgi:hypothetical protein